MIKVMSLVGALAASACCVVACGGGDDDGKSPDVELDGVKTLGKKGCNKHVDCDDGNECTVDTCVYGRGCRNEPAPANTACDDGNACTANDVCTAGACSGSQRYTFTDVVFPGNDSMSAFGINSSGDVVGQYQSAAENYVVHGFTYHAGTYTSIPTRPGATENWLNAIDDSGRLLGYTSSSDAQHPFIYENGVFTPIAELDDALNIPVGWNPAGDIAGISGQSGFLFQNGARTTFTYPGAAITGATGISANGAVVGYSLNVGEGGAVTDHRSFVLQGGSFTNIAVPGALATYAYGINGTSVVGWTQSADSNAHAFVKRGAAFTIIDVPGSVATYAWGINASGQVVGMFEDGPFRTTKGFIATPATSCTGP